MVNDGGQSFNFPDEWWIKTDASHRIIEYSSIDGKILGFDRSRILEFQSVFDLLTSQSEIDKAKTYRSIPDVADSSKRWFEVQMKSESGENRTVRCAIIRSSPTKTSKSVEEWICRDISKERKQAAVQEALLRLIDFANTHSGKALLQRFLDEAELLTESTIGFFHFVDPDQQNLALQVWSTNTMANMCKASGGDMHYPISKAGVWVDCVRERKPVIHNDYAAMSGKRGLPEGHAPVLRELVVPVFRSGKIVAILGVGNKPVFYNEQDVETVQRLADLTWETYRRKDMEEQAQLQRAELEAIYDSAPLVLLLIDSQGRIRKLNMSSLELKGNREAFIGKGGGDLLQCVGSLEHPDGCGHGTICSVCPLRGAVMDTFKSRKPKFREPVPLTRKNGNQNRWTEFLLSTNYLELSQGSFVLVCLEDVTERNEISRRIVKERERAERIIRGTNVGTWDWDLEKNQCEISQNWLDEIGFQSCNGNTLHFNDWLETIQRSDTSRFQFVIDQHLEGTIPFIEVEFRQLNAAGEWIWVFFRASIVERNEFDKPIRISGTLLDVSERKNVQLRLHKQNLEYERLNQELERANQRLEAAREAAEQASRAKSEFLAVMSHELRTPLNPILGFAQLLQEEITDETQIDWLESIKTSAEQELRMIDGVLNYSRLERQEIHPKEESFDLVRLCRNSLNQVAVVHGHLEFKYEDCPDWDPVRSGDKVIGDGNMVAEVVDNLLNNACKYTPNGKVCVRLGKRRIEGMSGYRFRIEVQDTGLGIDRDMQEKIFSPFVQADSSYTRRFQGAGLGLAICRKLIDVMGGSIGVVSELGQGSIFWVELQLESANEISVYDPASDSDTANSKIIQFPRRIQVLLVEDVLANQRVMNAFLRRMGAEVTTAFDGRDAIEKVDHQHFDCILMDLSMPNMNGFEATRYILAQSKFNQTTPIIAITAEVTEKVAAKCRDYGMVDFISKPVRLEQLNRVISANVV